MSISAFILASCSGSNNNGRPKVNDTLNIKDSLKGSMLNAPSQNMEYCFIRTEGAGNVDTTVVHLVMNGEAVSGNMQWLPKEKDARKGNLKGTLSGNDIKAVWTFMQEGTKDTMAVRFKLSAQQLAQKPFKVSNSGRQETDESAGYTLLYKLDNCSKFKTAAKPAL